jgi:hypothetical protein
MANDRISMAIHVVAHENDENGGGDDPDWARPSILFWDLKMWMFLLCNIKLHALWRSLGR